MNTNRLLGLSLKEISQMCDEEAKAVHPNIDFKVFSQSLISSIDHLDSVHGNRENFRYFLNIFARGVATITLEEIRKYNMLEIFFRECFIMVPKYKFKTGQSPQEEFSSLLKFLVNKIPKKEFKEFCLKYKDNFEHTDNSVLREMFLRVQYD